MNGAPLRNFAPPTQQQQQQQQLQHQQQQQQLQQQHLHQQLQAAVAAASTSADQPRTPTTPVVSRPAHWLSPDLQLRPPFYPRLDPALANRLYFGHMQGGGAGGPTAISALPFQTAGASGVHSQAAANALLQQSYQHYMLTPNAAAAAQHYAAASAARLPPYLDPTTFLAGSALPRYAPYLLNSPSPSSPSTVHPPRHPHSPQQSTGMPPPPPPGPLPMAAGMERSYSESDGGILGGGHMSMRDAHQRKLSVQASSNRHSHQNQVSSHSVPSTSASSVSVRPKLESRGPTELGATLPTQPYYPSHFMRGTVIQLASGELKRVEELNTEDFIRSASLSDDLKMDSSTVVRVEEKTKDTSVLLCFSVGEHKVQVSVEATVEHPFFVIGQGWSSCNPDRTRNLYGLPCQRLQVGDICISLTHRDVHTRLPPAAVGVSPQPTASAAAASSSSSATTGSTLSLPTTAAAAVASMSASDVDAASSGRRSVPATSAYPPIGSKRRWSVSS